MSERHIITILGYPVGTASDEVIDSERVGAVLEEVARNGIRWLGHDWKPSARPAFSASRAIATAKGDG